MERNLRKTRVGKVVSDKMDKTVVVAIADNVKHPLYKKIIVSLQPNGSLDDLFVKGVLYVIRDGDDTRFVHLVAVNLTNPRFSQVSFQS